jgi:hypothetical protein
MKYFYALTLAIVLSLNAIAQTPVIPSKASNKIAFKSEMNNKFSISDNQNPVLEYGDDVIIVLNEYTLKTMKNFFFSFYATSHETGTQIVRYNKKSKKLLKSEIINTPFRGEDAALISSFIKGDSMVFFHMMNSKKLKSDFLFATYYNLIDKRTKTIKIFQTNEKEFVKLYSTKNGKYVITSLEETDSDYKLSYSISDFESNILNTDANVKLPNVTNKDIVSIQLSEKGNIIANVLTPQDRKNIFSKQKYNNALYLIKNKRTIKLDVERLNSYSALKIIQDKNDEYRVICISKNKYGQEMGITIATIDEDNETIINEEFAIVKDFEFELVKEEEEKIAKMSSKRQARVKKRKKQELKSMNHLSHVKVAADNSIYVLIEYFDVSFVSHTYSMGNGSTSTSTTTYYNYGPGIIINFDNKNKVQVINKFNYNASFANYNPRAGLNFEPGTNNKILLSYLDDFYKITLVDKDLNLDDLIFGEKGLTFGQALKSYRSNLRKLNRGEVSSLGSIGTDIYKLNSYGRKSMDVQVISME